MGTVKYSGPVASFHCPTEATIRSLKVHFSPKQEGSGTPSPENVREIVGWDGVEVSQHGRNLYSKDNVIPRGTDAEWNGIMGGVKSKFAVNNWPRWTFLAPAIPNATYYWTVAGYEVGFLDKDENVITYKNSWNNKKIVAPANAAYVYHTWIKNETYSQEQLDAAFKTYDLYCDDESLTFEPQNSKKTNYEFGVLGKNKFPASDGTISDIFLVANTTYTFSATSPSAGYFKGWYEDETDTGLIWINAGADGDRRWKTYAPERNIIKGLFYVGTGMSKCQIELGSTVTTYEPYDPNKTVYGGWVDLISGEVTEEGINNHPYRAIILNGTEDWTLVKQDEQTTIFKYYYGLGAYSEGYSICSHFRMVLPSYTALGSPNSFVHGMSGNLFIQTNNTLASTIEDFKQYLSTQSQNNTPVTILFQAKGEYESYVLAPISLQTFLSTNNVWSNADYVEVEYDLHETQSILARKQFIVANQPHIVKPAAAPLQNFVTDLAAPLKECKVEFKPVQDLHGYDKPWVGGSGKNLFNINAVRQDPSDTTAINTTLRVFEPNTYCVGTSYSNYYYPTKINSYSVSNNTLTVNSDTGYAVGFAIKATAETTYFISASIVNNGRIGVAYYDSTGQWISGETNKQNKSFTTPVNTDIIVLCFNSPANQTEVSYSNIQLEVGSVATTYEPWENVCPISGWTGLTMYRIGKNLLNERFLSNYANYPITGDYGYKYTAPILLEPNTAYRFSFTNPPTYETTRYWAVKVYDDAYTDINDAGTVRYLVNNKATFNWNITTGAKGAIRFAVYGEQATLDDIWNNTTVQLEVGDTITDYEPYTGTVIPITLPSETSTIYGGYVDLVTGEVWKTYYEINITELGTYRTLGINKNNNTQVSWFLSNHLNAPDATAYVAYSRDGYCSCAPFLVNNYYWDSKCQVNNSTADLIIEGELTAEEVDAWIKAHAPIQIVYPLKTSQLITTLTPTQLKTLRGTNNIWSNSNGDITVQFWKH